MSFDKFLNNVSTSEFILLLGSWSQDGWAHFQNRKNEDGGELEA